MATSSQSLPGLTVKLNRLVYHYDVETGSEDTPHIFIYFLTIENQSYHPIRLLGRRWVIEYGDGSKQIVEGEKIVGETPYIEHGSTFSYNSFHVTGQDAKVYGSFHGIDEQKNHIRVSIPQFSLTIPIAH
jgi:ApaG protein